MATTSVPTSALISLAVSFSGSAQVGRPDQLRRVGAPSVGRGRHGVAPAPCRSTERPPRRRGQRAGGAAPHRCAAELQRRAASASSRRRRPASAVELGRWRAAGARADQRARSGRVQPSWTPSQGCGAAAQPDHPVDPARRALEPGSASSTSSIAEKCERLGTGSPTAWTAASSPAATATAAAPCCGCSPNIASAASRDAVGTAMVGPRGVVAGSPCGTTTPRPSMPPRRLEHHQHVAAGGAGEGGLQHRVAEHLGHGHRAAGRPRRP